MLLLGNDIVDLNEAGVSGKSKDTRFLSRVFSEQEQATISDAANPDLTLWVLWAAKETAYKIVSKLTSPPVFAHQNFEGIIKKVVESGQNPAIVSGQVRYATYVIELEAKCDLEYVHALGTFVKTGRLSDYSVCINTKELTSDESMQWQNDAALRKDFTKKELASIHHANSALVRSYCKQDIAERLKIDSSRLQIIRPTREKKPQPPYLLLDNKRSKLDISLSHHGKWLAWAYSMPTGNNKLAKKMRS